MSQERLFEQLIHELQVLIAVPSERNLISSSRILRQLLVDGGALLHLVNRKVRASLIFRVRKFSESSPLSEWMNPELFCDDNEAPHVDLDLQQFLAHRVGMVNGKEITIRQVIKYAAIILGGVHFKVDSGSEYEAVAHFHANRDKIGLSPVLVALRQIGAITRDVLIPVRDLLINRKKFESGKGWTALFCLDILPGALDEDNYIFDLGVNENTNRFSVYVDVRGELTFRIIDRNGARRYLRVSGVGYAVPAKESIIVTCVCSTVGDETLLSLRVGGWDHTEIVESFVYQEVGNPLHFVMGSDCLGKKHTHMFWYGDFFIAKPLAELELAQVTQWLESKTGESAVGLHYQGNQFMHSAGHPNFLDRINQSENPIA